LAYIASYPGLFTGDISEVHISVAFTWDKSDAERYAKAWTNAGYLVKIGGPAYGDNGTEFIPGRYLKPGYVITSRGCNNHCWFCSVWKREGALRELPITEGWNLLDNNILQCSESHIRAVFAMLKSQPHKAEFTGGLEAKLLQDWHIDLLLDLKPKQLFFAYDTKDDLEPLIEAGRKLKAAGFPMHPHSHALRCYVLIGHPHDTLEWAEERLQQTMTIGFTPMAMLWKDEDGTPYGPRWPSFQRRWARPQIIHARGNHA
jgi:hypothetical protein